MTMAVVLLKPDTYIVIVFRKKILVGSHGKNSCVDETFPCHKIKYPLHLLNTPNAHKTADDNVRNAFLRRKSFLCLEMKSKLLKKKKKKNIQGTQINVKKINIPTYK